MLLHNANPSQYQQQQQQQYHQPEPALLNQTPLENCEPHHQLSQQHSKPHCQSPPQQQFLPTSNSYSLATTNGFRSNLAMNNPENYHQIQTHHQHQHRKIQHSQNHPDLVIEQAVSSLFFLKKPAQSVRLFF